MKKLILLLFLFAFGNDSKAQAIFDFNTKKINDTLRIRYGSKASLEIHNINRFVHQAEINTTIVEYLTAPTNAIENLFIKVKKDAVDSTEKATEEMAVVKSTMEKIKLLSDSNLLALQKSMDSLVIYCTKYANSIKDLSSLQKVADILKSISTKAEFNSVIKMKAAMERNEIDALLKKGKSEEKKFEDYYYYARKTYQKALRDARKANMADSVIIKTQGENIEMSYENLEEKLVTLNLETNNFIEKLLQEESYTSYSVGRAAKGDEIEFEVKIDKETLNPFIFETKGGIKIDYSIGPLISIGKNAQNEIPFFKKVNDTLSTLETRFSENRVSLGLASFMHITNRTGKNARTGLLIGITTDLKDVTNIETNFAIGPTVVLGKKTNLISLAAGINLNRVDRFNEDLFTKGDKYKNGSLALGTTVEKVFKPSFFFSVTYIIPKRKTS